MKIYFSKYHGHGNDFILVDNMSGKHNLDISTIKFLCHRHYGIGSDGLILLESAKNCDYFMNFYNPDGSQSLCGNGSRCALHFARSLGIIDSEATFLAYDGLHNGSIKGNFAGITLNDVNHIEEEGNYYFLNNGSPHYVEIVQEIDKVDVYSRGREIRNDPKFQPGGTNVNFIEFHGRELKSRIYERGVENETLSSGTGTVASALCAYLHGFRESETITVSTRGGKLEVSFKYLGDSRFSKIRLSGDVCKVFESSIEV